MSGLGNILEVIGGHPLAKWLVLLLFLRAAWTFLSWRRCVARIDADGPEETLEAIEARRQALWRPFTRFAVVMLAGIALAVTGLFRLAAAGTEAAPALLMLGLGMYLFLTEPVRIQIADAEDRVAAARAGPAEGQETAEAILRDAHVKLVAIETGAALALGLAILALR